jgi:wyosine [tRNA(Phe)-imidazoG37] synthetase (radical SAM superfamily)
MVQASYVFGPVPSRRLGLSLGISPIPKKTCNYSCVYCQLGRTDHLTNTRQWFFPVQDILSEVALVLATQTPFDVISIVGEGEPTLYAGLSELILGLKRMTDRPVAVITNGALLFEADVQEALMQADLVLPSLDAYDELSFNKINRPHGSLKFETVFEGLRSFSLRYEGQLWIEIMLMAGVNDDDASLLKYQDLLQRIRYDRLYLNTTVRPPAESEIQAIGSERMKQASELLGGFSIETLESEGFHSDIADDLEAVLSIIRRHPMNQYEINLFLSGRDCADSGNIMGQLKDHAEVEVIHYKGYETYRLK